MRWWKYNGLVPGQTVDAHVEETAHCQTQNGKYEYSKYFHGCLLWMYYGLKSIAIRYYFQARLLLSLQVPIYRDVAIWMENRTAPFLRLPVQERVGHVVNDIPDIGGVSLV